MPASAEAALAVCPIAGSRSGAAGLVAEHWPGAPALADTMFRCEVTSWCSTWF